MISKKVFQASAVAASLFKDKKRHDGTPYIHHLMAVALIVSRYTQDDELIIAAILHDVIEDIPKAIYSEAQLLEDFGDRVFKIIANLSDRQEPTSSAIETKTWKARKLKYLANLETVDLDTLLICCADKIHNLYDLNLGINENGAAFWKTFHASREEEIWYHETLLSIFSERMPGPMVKELTTYLQKIRAA